MSDPSGSGAAVPRTTSLIADNPSAASAAHIAGSQATIALAVTWAAFHVAVSSRVAADAPSAASGSDAGSEPRAATEGRAVTARPVTARTVHAPSPPRTTR